MLDETIYRCISASCARPLPRRVNFCPYCGVAQHAGAAEAAQQGAREAALPGADRPGVVLDKPAAGMPPPQPAAGAAGPMATEWGASARAAAGASTVPGAGTAGAAAASPRPPASPTPSPAAPRPPAPPAPASAARGPTAPATPAPARPPQRAPVPVRWWLVALAALWLVWIKEKPASNRVDARIDRAIALATECKAREAQSELIALRSTSATQEQLLRVQQALNDAAAACSRSRQRDRGWRGAGADAHQAPRKVYATGNINPWEQT